MGWYKQQLIKLAAADLVTTPFYVTLDSDVISTRQASIDDFVWQGRGVLQVEHGGQELWYRQTAKGLGLPEAPDHMGVTPAVLSADAVNAMLRWVGGHRQMITKLPWTENAAY